MKELIISLRNNIRLKIVGFNVKGFLEKEGKLC